MKRKARSEITEEIVEGIYSESQYKIENIPGYAEAFQRVADHFRKFTEENYQPNEDDDKKLQRAMGELMMIEWLHRWDK